MSAKYLTNMTTALLGGLVVVISMAMAGTDSAWTAFGIAIGILTIAVLSQLQSARGLVQRLVDLGAGMVAVATIVTSLVFGGAAATWDVFGLALGFVGLGVAGLTVHEIETWRAQHHLAELSLFHRREDRRLAA